MNQHSIPIGVHRKLGLDNIEPSGLGGDRRSVADVEAKAAQKALAPLEPQICEIARRATVVSIVAENLNDGLVGYGKSGVSANVLRDNIGDDAEALAALADDLKDLARKLRDEFYVRWNEAVI